MSKERIEYLGDGVYAIHHGYCVWLHANDLKNPTDRICLEGPVLKNLIDFAKKGTVNDA